jgi:hypothetical protein
MTGSTQTVAEIQVLAPYLTAIGDKYEKRTQEIGVGVCRVRARSLLGDLVYL